jgi:hypothetical protein
MNYAVAVCSDIWDLATFYEFINNYYLEVFHAIQVDTLYINFSAEKLGIKNG